MRKFWYRLGGTVKLLAALAVCGMLLLLLHAPVFEGGRDYTFYLRSNSSARAIVSQNPVFDKILLKSTGGESVRYEGDRYEALKERYHARLLFTEEAAGTVCYYLYSPYLRGGVRLDGTLVNLQIAVGAEQTAVGTPLIFGGF